MDKLSDDRTALDIARRQESQRVAKEKWKNI